MIDQAAKLREMVNMKPGSASQGQLRTEIIAIASGKGGVGKSNITANLGLALEKMEKKVLLIDADLGMANLDILLGLCQTYNLGHILKGKCEFEDAVIAGPEGLSVLAGISGSEEFVNLNSRKISRLLEVAARMESQFDIILIDIGAGIHSDVINFILGADKTLIVLTPEPTAVMDAYGLIKIIFKYKTQTPMGLIINQTQSTAEAGELANRMSKVIREYLQEEIEFIGSIPYDRYLKKAVTRQKPLLSLYPESRASKAVIAIAARIAESKDENKVKGVKGFMYRLMGLFNNS